MKYFIYFLAFFFIGCGSDTLMSPAQARPEKVIFTYYYDQCWDSLSRDEELSIFSELEQITHIDIIEAVPFKCEIPATESCWHKYILTINTTDINYTVRRINLFYEKHYSDLKISIDILPD